MWGDFGLPISKEVQMARMLRHKETGELFIWTAPLSALSELEPVVEDPVAAVIAEMATQNAAEDVAPVIEEEVELPVLSVVSTPAFVEAPAVEVEAPKPSAVRATTKNRNRAA